MKVGQKIQKLRELRNFNQSFMADGLGVTQGTYSKIESGNLDIPYSKLEQIAEILNIPVEVIIGFSEGLVFNLNDNKNANGLVINNVSKSEKKIYEEYIESLKTENSYLKSMIDKLLNDKST